VTLDNGGSGPIDRGVKTLFRRYKAVHLPPASPEFPYNREITANFIRSISDLLDSSIG
jgi:hypothetical protein